MVMAGWLGVTLSCWMPVARTSILILFFFQAEDGIRDLTVTGVQTCALPISSDTKFEDQRQKDLKDAYRVLTQAVTTGGQEKNPAAWYYLARYYEFQNDLGGADSTFAKAQELAPKIGRAHV